MYIYTARERERERGKEIRTVWMHLEPSAVAAAAVAAVVSSWLSALFISRPTVLLTLARHPSPPPLSPPPLLLTVSLFLLFPPLSVRFSFLLIFSPSSSSSYLLVLLLYKRCTVFMFTSKYSFEGIDPDPQQQQQCAHCALTSTVPQCPRTDVSFKAHF